MTAGLPGTHSGSTFHRRILAALLITTIAAAPAHAQSAAFPDSESAAPADLEDAALPAGPTVVDETPAAVADEAREAVVDAPPVETAPPAVSAEAASTDNAPAPSIDQLIYKGLVGNILEAMPLDPEQRVQLQRGNAIINNALTGRSLALLLGIASPPLMIVGLIWGIWSAINIKSAPAETQTALAPSQFASEAEEPASAAAAVQALPADGSASADRDHAAAQSLD